MPPLTPSATFMEELPIAGFLAATANCGSVRLDSLVERFAGHFDRALGNFGDHPLHLARPDFILGDAAGLAGNGVNHRRCPALQLSSPPGGDQDIAVVAVETVHQLHRIPPLWLAFVASARRCE